MPGRLVKATVDVMADSTVGASRNGIVRGICRLTSSVAPKADVHRSAQMSVRIAFAQQPSAMTDPAGRGDKV